MLLHTTGTTTSSKSCTCGNATKNLVHTTHDVEHQELEDNEGIQREVHRDQPRRLTNKLVSTVEASKH